VNNSLKEGKILYQSGHLHGEWPADVLLAKLDSLGAWRDSIPVKQKKAKKWLPAGLLLAVILFPVANGGLPHMVTGIRFADTFCKLLAWAGVISVIIAAIALVRFRLGKLDRDATAVLGPLVRCIGPDLAKGTKIRVKASLRPFTSSEFLVKMGEKYVKRGYKDCRDSFFKREVMSLECRLSDGTRLLTRMIEHTVKKVLKKKNPRGKWKTKTTYHRKIGLKVRLILDASRSQLTGQFRLPPDASIQVRQHPRGNLVLLSLSRTIAGTESLDARPLLTALLGIYGAVSPVQPNNPTPTGGAQ
jgi:hypothetical protein